MVTRENTIDVMEHTHARPKDGPPPRSWLDKGIARLVALALAAVLGILLVTTLGDEVLAVAGLGDDTAVAGDDDFDLVTDPAVQTCIEQRAGDVDTLYADGVITEAQHADFRSRAVAMCQSSAQVAPRA